MISLAEAAGRLGLNLDAAQEMVRAGLFCPVYRLSARRFAVRVDELDLWLQSKRIEPGSTPEREGVA